MKNFKILILLFYSVLLTGQEINFELKNKLSEIENYKIFVDSTAKSKKEGIAEGQIIYKKPFKKNGGWEAYYLSEIKNIPLRIKYSQTGIKEYETINLYYKNNELIYVEYITEKIGKKNKIIETNQSKYYFQNNELLYQTNFDKTNFDLSELLREEKRIREYYYKPKVTK